MTATITHATVSDYSIDLVNGFPVEVCGKCGGRGYLPGYERIDNARCWGCMGALYANTRSTSEAVERLAVRRGGGEVVSVEGVDAERARAIAEFVKVLDRRAKDRARRAARRAAGARVELAARQAVEDRAREVLDAVFDRFPAAVDITYYGNLLASGVNPRVVGGYEFAADRYLAGRVLSDRVLEIASEVTARLVGSSEVQALTGGRQVIGGVVRSARWVETRVGYREVSTLKMTVVMDGGQRVYGTVPAAILDSLSGGVVSGGDVPRDEVLRGRRVEFTATVEVSDDPVFGFYSRPSRASLVELLEA